MTMASSAVTSAALWNVHLHFNTSLEQFVIHSFARYGHRYSYNVFHRSAERLVEDNNDLPLG